MVKKTERMMKKWGVGNCSAGLLPTGEILYLTIILYVLRRQMVWTSAMGIHVFLDLLEKIWLVKFKNINSLFHSIFSEASFLYQDVGRLSNRLVLSFGRETNQQYLLSFLLLV